MTLDTIRDGVLAGVCGLWVCSTIVYRLCTERREAVAMRLDTAAFIAPMSALICLNLVVIIGNVMVIMAVFTHSKLRSMTTNKFIVSLALADLMVGVVVLPFSSANEVCSSIQRRSRVSKIRGVRLSFLSLQTFNYSSQKTSTEEKLGEGVPLPNRLGDLGSLASSSPSGVWGRAPAANDVGAFHVQFYELSCIFRCI